jgi:hypothetical protein
MLSLYGMLAQRVSWRQSNSWSATVRSAAGALLTASRNALGWVAFLVDWLIPSQDAYVGGAVLAEIAAARAEIPDQTAIVPR